MTRRGLLLLALASSLAAGEVRVVAEPDPEDGKVRLRIESDLPAGTVLVGSVYRTLGKREVGLGDVRMAVREGGRAEGACRLGKELAVAGTYRVGVRADGETAPLSGTRFEVGAGTPAFLALVREQEAFLSKSFATVGEFLDRMNVLEKEVREAPDAAAKAAVRARWGAWRVEALKPLGEIVTRGNSEETRCFPLTWEAFSDRYINGHGGLSVMESRKFLATETGGEAAAPHGSQGSLTFTRQDLEPLLAGFYQESAGYRLQAVNALFLAFQAGKGNRDRWESVLHAAEEGAPGFPAQKELTGLAAAMRALWDGTGSEDQVHEAFKALQEKAGASK